MKTGIIEWEDVMEGGRGTEGRRGWEGGREGGKEHKKAWKW